MGNKAGGRWVPQGPLRSPQSCPKASPQPHPGVLRGGSSAHPEPALPRQGQSWAGSQGSTLGWDQALEGPQRGSRPGQQGTEGLKASPAPARGPGACVPLLNQAVRD